MRPQFPISRIAYVLALTVVLSACSQKIDGSSLASFAQSVKQIEEKLPTEKAKAFDDDLATLMSRRALNLGQLRELTNGMSPDDVHTAALEAEAQWKSARLTYVRARTKVLEAAKAKDDAELAEFRKFTASINDFYATVKYNDQSGRFDGAAGLTLILHNQSSWTIAEFGYDLILTVNSSPYPTDPWSYRLEKPLRPGESVTVRITDKPWNEEDTNYSALSGRVVKAATEALQRDSKATLAATLTVTSVKLADGTYISPITGKNAELEDLRKELAADAL